MKDIPSIPCSIVNGRRCRRPLCYWMYYARLAVKYEQAAEEWRDAFIAEMGYKFHKEHTEAKK
ncbi:MAG: hypothetical protein PHV13_03015 [Candidatus ainarchaeum sp.]|nr:hypothetical protein [Candidatus ainarchaeum sp.]